MCGIAGFWLPKREAAPQQSDAMARMSDALRHRGPDAEGHHWEPGMGLGLVHRRLAIQDLSESGAQPMASASGRFLLVFNGEIYNFRPLTAELTRLGHQFRGHSDTEAMLTAFEQWGVEPALRRFAGMFAFALLDRAKGLLYLARDRLGEKPLYYGWHEGTFIFGSELKAIHAFRGTAPPINRDALPLLLRHNYIPSPHTIYEGLYKLPPAHCLTISLSGGAADEPQAYWPLESAFSPSEIGGPEAAVDELERRLGAVISEQMIADVPLGAFLSGGVDSSTVAALMQAQAPAGKVRTFSIGFRESEFDEAQHAAAVARHLGTDHTELYVSPDDALDVIPRLPAIYDEPFADSSQIPTVLLSELTRRHVTVALSGDGGDELFAGYPRYLSTAAAWQRTRVSPGLRQRAEAAAVKLPAGFAEPLVRLSQPAQRVLSREGLRGKLHREQQLRSACDLPAYYRERISIWNAACSAVRGATEVDYALNHALPASIARLPPIKQLQWLDLNSYLLDDILVKVDRAGMAASLETRVPLLDHRIVEFALGLPEQWNLREGTGKRVLRDLLYRYVPAALVDRPKRGFAVPLGAWLQGPLRGWAESLLAPERLRAEGFWHEPAVSAVWRDHLAQRDDYSGQLWGVLMFQAWLDEWRGQ